MTEEKTSRGRIPVDVRGGLRERIENAKNSVDWKELPLARKIRSLLIERLEQLESEAKKPQEKE